MTNGFIKYYKCPYCGQMVEYIYPIREYEKEYGDYTIEMARDWYKAKARYNHNMTHKGLLDGYGIE